MSEPRNVSEEMQNAFVDGELDPVEWERVAERIGRDPKLREEVAVLRCVKDLVRHACAVPPAQPSRAPRAERLARRLAAAAIVMLAAGLGWMGHSWWSGEGPDPASAYVLREAGGLDRDRVLVHVSSGERETLGRALDEVEDLLRTARDAKRTVRVEIVANRGGIDLVRAGVSQYASRIAALRAAYPDLALVACGQTLRRLRARGQSVELLPGTVVATSALDEVVARLHDGWVYVRA